MKRHRQDGVALLMVLLALALLAGGLSWLAQQGRQEVDTARQLQLRVQARAAETAARAFAVQALRDPLWRQSPLFWQALRGQPLPYRFAQGSARLQLRDLRSCFNVNALLGEESERARRQLLHLLGRAGQGPSMADERLVQTLVDWLDPDGQAQMQGAEADQYLRASSAYLPANQPMRETSELNLLLPADAGRYLRHPALCALPDTSGWRLNANALTLDMLPLLEALYEGELPRSLLTRLITARPADGYRDADALRRHLGALDEATFTRLAEGLLLNSDHFLLGLAFELDEQRYRTVYQVEVRGVSKWYSRVPAQQVLFRSRQPAPLWTDDAASVPLMP
ncbi:type II secretion system minor pseudopilin GspK [Stutzerimonas stutzeri]|uniref:Type II secretion system protein K n=1 Tax=Stutzerimonas stutzeri KOS6 TaxID=1218352 RepID=A0A061JU71_STUST|nr:type II secretion system minor pseudopilin GspK [Stutzerimonas stutzeri]EWC43291.1 general secretion pathway protein K [Stutzerimonas stutzeri KOS6]